LQDYQNMKLFFYRKSYRLSACSIDRKFDRSIMDHDHGRVVLSLELMPPGGSDHRSSLWQLQNGEGREAILTMGSRRLRAVGTWSATRTSNGG
jgi:hypothetical protein